MSGQPIFTVGHSNVDSEAFVALLRRHAVTVVADVRSQPYSRFLPHFNRDPLKASLRAAEIGYVFLGRELGVRPDDPTCYVDGIARYERIAATAPFREGIARLLRGQRTARIALLCAEKDPLTCHRTILVCRHLRRPGLAIWHILGDGTLESHEQAEQRLIRLHGLHQASFLDPRTPAETLEEAYDRQAARIAYGRSEQHDDEHPAATD